MTYFLNRLNASVSRGGRGYFLYQRSLSTFSGQESNTLLANGEFYDCWWGLLYLQYPTDACLDNRISTGALAPVYSLSNMPSWGQSPCATSVSPACPFHCRSLEHDPAFL